jgi:hypothetical protein
MYLMFGFPNTHPMSISQDALADAIRDSKSIEQVITIATVSNR